MIPNASFGSAASKTTRRVPLIFLNQASASGTPVFSKFAPALNGVAIAVMPAVAPSASVPMNFLREFFFRVSILFWFLLIEGLRFSFYHIRNRDLNVTIYHDHL